MITKLQNIILEMIARGASLKDTVDTLCKSVEHMAQDVHCSVLMVEDGKRVRHLSSPSLPQHYAEAIDGLLIGPGVGSCGTAAYTGQPVTVTDISTHPFWKDFKALALPIGLHACWSTPIISSGRVLGTFAFYFRSPRAPTELEEDIVAACTHLCAIVMERDLRATESQRMAQTDALTQLPNRARFNALVDAQGRESCPWGLLFADLDGLKLVNDRLGHAAGDELIRETARRMASVSPDGLCFRLGGDEFAIIVRGSEEPLETIAGRVLDAIREPCLCSGQQIRPSLTIGGAIAQAGDTAEQVRQKADYALYDAKEHGRGRYVEYVPGIGSAIAKRFRAIQDLSDALLADRIEPYYQPIVELHTGRILGVEALCRMTRLDGSVLAAESFQEATRDGQTAAELTRRMLKKVAADARRWIDGGLAYGRVAVNLSAADFCQGGLAASIAEVFSTAGVPLTSIVLEVTESVYLDRRDHSVAQQIGEMRAIGMSVALDDFGTGFASLTHLLSVPVDLVKIDKSFVDRMAVEKGGMVIIKGLVDIAKGLNISVVAEGIETVEQGGLLLSLGCQKGQGYLFSRAVDFNATTELLRNHGAQAPSIRRNIEAVAV